jgi:hypothetical protein
MKSKTAALLGLALILPAPALAALGGPEEESEPPKALDLAPSPTLTPQQVVEIQLGGLADNAEWGHNRGIALTFRFASPGNKKMTGPLPRFIRMVRGPTYGALVDHRSAQIGPVQMRHGRALLPVLVEDRGGEDRGFVWVLGRQTEGRFADCWMTDAVYPVDASEMREVLPGRTEI